MTLRMFNPAHPGRILHGCFTNRKQADAAAAEGIGYQDLVAIYEGRADITRDMAARLGRVLGHSSEFWLRLQNQYDEWQRDPRQSQKRTTHRG